MGRPALGKQREEPESAVHESWSGAVRSWASSLVRSQSVQVLSARRSVHDALPSSRQQNSSADVAIDSEDTGHRTRWGVTHVIDTRGPALHLLMTSRDRLRPGHRFSHTALTTVERYRQEFSESIVKATMRICLVTLSIVMPPFQEIALRVDCG